MFNQAAKEELPLINDHHNFKIPINYNDFINFTGRIWISQGLFDADAVLSDEKVFDLKIRASIVSNACDTCFEFRHCIQLNK